ncbi:MAG TPA: acyltransferase [Oligoflexus sp.]|uniref:acyltransferase n=1 Tax=Oligoflexus sp. TaxID=1971216 RepID=UPI002D26EFEA|nr:acyltransferase [Oligoflexus sp.]HYX37547.1 acyltransferase [Oligoflexus sp.]
MSFFQRALVLVRSSYFLRFVPRGKKVRVHGRLAVQSQGELYIGAGTCFHSGRTETELVVHAQGRMRIGADCMINNGCVFNASGSIQIGDRCRFGYGVLIFDSDLHEENPQLRHIRPEPAPVTIEDDVWIGSRAIILAGIRIGQGSIVGAGSIVTRDVPPNTVVAGNPARILREVEQS